MIGAVWLFSLLLLGLAGCRARPMQVVGRGSMDMNGAMAMTGNMNVTGDVSAAVRTSNTASQLASVTVHSPKHSVGNFHPAGKVALLDVDGLIVNRNLSGMGSMGENPVALFREKLDSVAADSTIKAVVLRINSPGGGVTASDIMGRDLQEFKSQRSIPVVASILDVGAGGAYYLATYSDAIVAHPTSIVGGVGVILNVYNLEDTLGQFNILPVPIKAGNLIDLGSPERAMPKNERAVLESIANAYHQRFIDRVKASRPALAANEETFDGRVFTGDEALRKALIDKVGYLDDALLLAKQMSGLTADSSVIMLRRDNDRAHTQFDVTPNIPVQASIVPLKVPGLDRSSLPTFLYLWQADPSFVTSSGG